MNIEKEIYHIYRLELSERELQLLNTMLEDLNTDDFFDEQKDAQDAHKIAVDIFNIATRG